MGIRRVLAGLAWNRLLMRVYNSTGEGTSGMDKFSSEVHRVNMELGGKLLDSLRIKTQFLERLQNVSVVDGATRSQKDDVESNRGSLENVAEIFVLFLCDVQLVLRSGVFTILDLDEVDVTPRFTEVFRSVQSRVGGSTGGWRCCWDAPSLPQLPPATPKNPPPYINLLFLCFCSDGSNQYKIWAAGGKSVFIWEAGWEEPPFGNNSTFSCFRNLENLHGHSFVACCLYLWRQCMILRSLFCW